MNLFTWSGPPYFYSSPDRLKSNSSIPYIIQYIVVERLISLLNDIYNKPDYHKVIKTNKPLATFEKADERSPHLHKYQTWRFGKLCVSPVFFKVRRKLRTLPFTWSESGLLPRVCRLHLSRQMGLKQSVYTVLKYPGKTYTKAWWSVGSSQHCEVGMATAVRSSPRPHRHHSETLLVYHTWAAASAANFHKTATC